MESPRAITRILLPSKRTNLLHRPRLVDFLHAHIERKLFLLSASAGYGKTSLLIDFAHDTTLPVCWYSLDASDADPKTFLEYLVASLRHRFPGFGERTLSLLSDAAMVRDVDVVVGTLVTEIHESIPDYFVLIVDDYHVVEESAAVNHIVDSFLRLSPENAHLVLASRTLPSKLTLTRLTARQEIAGLGVNDLRFSAEEIRALVQQNYHIDLAEKDAAQLAASSEGWITGILLTTHSLWQGLFQDLVRLQGPHSHVFNYLASEVFAQQPHDLQRFLLETSVFDQLNPALCNRLLSIENAADMLRVVEQKNLFIVHLEEGGAWYRYHHLFQEFLQSRLLELDVAHWRDLNRRAALLFEEAAARDQAVTHYAKAHAFEDAARVIEQVANETFDAGHWTTLAKWIDALPADVLESYPDLLVKRAMVFNEMGDSERSGAAFARASTIYENREDAAGLAATYIEQASCWRMQGRYQQAIDSSQRALTLIGDAPSRDAAEARRVIGISFGMLGDWKKSIDELEAALRIYNDLNDWPRVARLPHALGVAHRTLGSPAAQNHFEQALDYWRRADNVPGLANTLNSIGVGYYREGKHPAALETLEQALAQTRRCGQLRIEAFALASLGDVHRDTGELGAAQKAYQAAFEIGRQINEGFVITYALNALGETCRLMGDLNAADRLIHQALEQAESHRSNYEVALAETALGILDYTQGDTETAADRLERAIALLDRGGAKRENARAHLHLAQTQFLQRKYRQVSEHLQATADLGRQLREDQFALADGKQLLPLIHYAVSKKIGNGYFFRVLEKIKSLPAKATDSTSPELPLVHTPRVEARAFGTAAAFVDGKLVTKTEWDSSVTKELFFFLLANPQGLPKDQILSALWGDTSAAKANGIFHSTAYRMRRALSPDCLVYANGLYTLSPAMDLWHDVVEFKTLIDQAGHAKSREACAQCWRDAIALYQGDYFEDSYSDWSIPIRTNLLEKYLTALVSLGIICDQDGRTEEAIELYQKVLAKDPFREDVYQALMRLQIRLGDRAGALRTYQRCAQVLRDEMDLEPSSETQRLYEQVSQNPSRT